MELYEHLIDYGLTEKEAKVYVATLELGSSSVNSIASRSKIFRTYCYDVLRLLADKGFVTSITRKGVRYFEAVNPEKLIDLLKDKEHRISEILSQLQLLQKSSALKPLTEVFEGKEGIKSIHQDILRTGEDHMVLGTSTVIKNFLGPWFDFYVQERVRRNIHVRVLTDDSEIGKEVLQGAKENLREVRFYRLSQDIHTSTYIYGSKIAMIMYGREIFGVIIRSAELARTQRVIFEELWKAAGKR